MTENIGENKESACDCCGESWSELPEFEAKVPIDISNIGAGFKKVKTRIMKTHRKECEGDDIVMIGSSLECRNCLGLTTE